MKGKIIKGIAGFYYVHVPLEDKVYECKAKGIFRNQNLKPLVGDDVEIDTNDQPEGKGIIVRIFPRRNELVRPAVANIDQAMVIFAAAEPEPNLNLLDRFLVMMKRQQIPAIVCFNKKDIAGEREMSLLKETYQSGGYDVITTSVLQGENLSDILQLMKGKTTVLAGPSGVGKSSLINSIQPEIQMETGSVSEKIKRGKHTTRHSELICVDQDTYIMDTPGFSSLFIHEIDKQELKDYFTEFLKYECDCRFIGCMHLNEPGCAVKDALNNQKISRIRYDNYVTLYEELKNHKKY